MMGKENRNGEGEGDGAAHSVALRYGGGRDGGDERRKKNRRRNSANTMRWAARSGESNG